MHRVFAGCRLHGIDYGQRRQYRSAPSTQERHHACHDPRPTVRLIASIALTVTILSLVVDLARPEATGTMAVAGHRPTAA